MLIQVKFCTDQKSQSHYGLIDPTHKILATFELTMCIDFCPKWGQIFSQNQLMVGFDIQLQYKKCAVIPKQSISLNEFTQLGPL